jgi:16S rRNA (cytidine1402-2'-O)-methyltransferase
MKAADLKRDVRALPERGSAPLREQDDRPLREREPALPQEQDARALPPGTLYIVATPIGNREDITLRALRILGSVDLVAAEDTRRTGLLLQSYGIKKPLMSCFAHNEEKQSKRLLELLGAGKTVALVSDAGMPGISDPGARLIRQAVAAEVSLTVIPGPSAVLTALAASGLDTGAFAFGGFFPRDNKGRKDWLERFGGFTGAVIFYESPRRLVATLTFLAEALGVRRCCVARELTKRYEEFIRGGLPSIAESLRRIGEIKGEIVVVLEGNQNKKGQCLTADRIEALGRALLEQGVGKKEASRRLADETGLSAKATYAMLVALDRGTVPQVPS